MYFLRPHCMNPHKYSDIRVDIDFQVNELIVEFKVPLDEINISDEFSCDTYQNNGLWNFDVAEVFLKKGKETKEYLELQVSPKSQKFALLVLEPRRKTVLVDSLSSCIYGNFDHGVFSARFEIKSADIPGEGNEIFGNLFCCLGSEDKRCYFGANINNDEIPDYHRPDLFIKLGETLP